MDLSQIEYAKILPATGFSYCSQSRYLFLLVRSAALLTWDGHTRHSSPEQLCYVLPGQTLLLLPIGQYGLLDYFEFSMNAAEQQLFDTLPLPCAWNAPPNFSELSARVRNLYHLFYSSDKYRQQKADLDFLAILYATASGDEDPVSSSREQILYARLRQLRKQISDDPTCYTSVAQAAQYAGLSESRFSHLYKQYFSVSYLNDLIHSRIKRSCMLLQTTDRTVSSIAQSLGYDNETFFYRQFRAQMGVSPSRYRQMNLSAL